MANRRVSGMGGYQRGNRSFSQPFQGSNVSPWQGNNQSGNQGLLSQLSSNPQQLALALTSLLQPQQNPPSLLSLNTSPAFSNQESRFGSVTRGRSDFRRLEPYNKNRTGGWRQLDGRGNRNNNRGGGGGGGGGPAGRDNRKKDVVKKEKSDKDDSKVDTIDLSMDEKAEEDGEGTKRDWKDEKNTGDEKKDENGKERSGKYSGIPQGLLHCFVCNKNMWDGESFDKHVRGRAHKQMLGSLDESFHITVNILRESMRLAEEKKMIEVNRMERLSKKHRKYEPESNCNMCDLKFLGKIISHRKTEGHQRLKRFLHPNCDVCSKEFPSRMEWVEHRLTEEHLKELSEYMEKRQNTEDGNLIIQELEIDLEPLLEESISCEDEHPIMELSEDMTNLQNRIPAYKKNREVSKESLKPFTGFVCELCQRSFTTEEIAKEHLKTQRHYHAFVEAAKNKYKKQMEDAAAEKAAKAKEVKEAKVKEEVDNSGATNGEDMYDPEEACKEGDQTQDSQDEESILKDIEDELLDNTEDVKEEETVEEAPVETKTTVSPRGTRRAAAGVAAATSNVKNGAGPKSKKARK